MTDIRERLLAAFELEHKDHLAAIREDLRAIERDPDHIPDLVEIHRRAHSLKGAARAVELPEVERLAHHLEAVFLAIQRGGVRFDPAVRGAVRRGLDAIEDVVAWATRGGAPVAVEEVVEELNRLGGEAAGPAPVRRTATLGATLGATRGATPTSSARIDRAPTPAGPPDRRRAARADDEAGPAMVRIRSAALERLFTASAGLLPELENQSALVEQLRELRAEWRALERSWNATRPRLARGDDTAARLALFERRFRSLGAGIDATLRSNDRHLWSLRRWSGRFQDEMRQMRLLPADSQFSDLGRMIRELSRAHGKEVEVDLRGLDTEADRTVLQRLKDPVLHIARNAVGHGVETARERVAAGKRAAATIRFSASVAGNRLVLRLEDDGRGLDTAAIARRAVERDLLSAEEAAAATPERLRNLIFEPGFSTADATTELAGRGMGLAIVRQEVARLQGTVSVSARPAAEGGGTAVIIEVPLSLLSQRLVFVAVRDDQFALPSTDVVRLLRLPPEEVRNDLATPTILVDGEDIPVVPLASLLGFELAEPTTGGRVLKLAVVRGGGRRLALLVDELLATRDAVIATADEVGIDPLRFVGTVLLDDGSPALVLNPAGLSHEPGGTPTPPLRPEEAKPRRAHILVVDDSITTRTLEKSILEAHGYDVTLCVDGREAVERLADRSDVDLIISDVEMPRMDGFALLQAVKGNPLTADLPVILVTSRASDEDRERGLTLGADAYIVKTRFDQNELLAGIRRLL